MKIGALIAAFLLLTACSYEKSLVPARGPDEGLPLSGFPIASETMQQSIERISIGYSQININSSKSEVIEALGHPNKIYEVLYGNMLSKERIGTLYLYGVATKPMDDENTIYEPRNSGLVIFFKTDNKLHWAVPKGVLIELKQIPRRAGP